MQLAKKTSLQQVGTDIKETLDWKLKQLKDKNLPIEEGLADYIYLGMNGIDSDIEQLDNYMKVLKDKQAELKANKQATSEKVADWLLDAGLDKINGISVSSITINKATESKESSKERITFKILGSDKIYNNSDMSFLVEDLIEEGTLIRLVGFDKVVSKATNNTIKINKKRK